METLDSTPKNNPSSFQFALKWALIVALAQIAFSMTTYLTNQMENRAVNWLAYLIVAVIAYIAVKNFRDNELGGNISFGKGFGLSFQIIFFAGLVMTVYTVIFFKYIDPDFMNHMMQKAEQGMIDKGMPDDQIEMGMKYTKMFMNPGVMAGIALFGSAFMGVIISLIVAAICKRENKQLLPTQ